MMNFKIIPTYTAYGINLSLLHDVTGLIVLPENKEKKKIHKI